MRLFSSIRLVHVLAVSVLALALLVIGGCSPGLEGTYVPEGFSPVDSITFKSGGIVEITGFGLTRQATYERDGDKIKINIDGETTVLTIDSSGCLDSGGPFGRFCRKK
jgi:hypothetical protein